MCRERRGPNENQGTINSMKRFQRTPNFWNQCRGEIQKTTQRIGQRLGLVMIVKAGQVAPAGVAAQFDKSRAEHDPKPEPAIKPEDKNRRRTPRKRAGIEQGTKEDGKEAGLQDLDFPAIAVPDLANMDIGHVRWPREGHDDGICISGQDHQGERKPGPRDTVRSRSENPARKGRGD